jgi:CrcB protein
MTESRSLFALETTVPVAIGGFAGANVRYAVDLAVGRALTGTVLAPIAGTLLVNVLGSFALGLLLYETAQRKSIPERGRLVLGTGFLSSFTTYSTFVVDAVTTAGSLPALAFGYVLGSYLFGIAAVLIARGVVDQAVRRWT